MEPARSRCATSSAPGGSSWLEHGSGTGPVRPERGPAPGRETLRRLVRPVYRRRLLLGAAGARADRSARAQLARLRRQAAPEAAHRAPQAAERVFAEAGEPLPPPDAGARTGEVRPGARRIPGPHAVHLYR